MLLVVIVLLLIVSGEPDNHCYTLWRDCENPEQSKWWSWDWYQQGTSGRGTAAAQERQEGQKASH